MSILGANLYHKDNLAEIYRVLFLDQSAENGWGNLVDDRNYEYAKYLTPPNTASGTHMWDLSIRTGQMASTVDMLNNKWNKYINQYIDTAIDAGLAKRIKT